MRKSYTLRWNNHCLELGARTQIMGIVNITPDSFSDGGKFFSYDHAVAQAEKLVNDGADIIDIGGESTRPFAKPVSVEEEIQRVIPVIKTLAARVSIPISIDTRKSEVARQAIEAGASIINDIGALRLDPDMGAVAATYGVPVILMHMKGTPETMQIDPVYEDLIGEIRMFFEHAVVLAEKKGIPRSRLILDPGIGFGKTIHHNLILIQRLQEFASLDIPILIGTSRKAFIRNILKDSSGKALTPDRPEVEIGTQATIAASILNGAHIVRVHDVANTRITVKLIDAIINQCN